MGMGTGLLGDWEAEVLSLCFLSILGLRLNGALLDINSVNAVMSSDTE